MTGVLLQVRLDSTRLPNKALLKIKDLTVIEHAMKSLKMIKVQKHILVTTSDSVEKLKPLADKWGYELFVGSKHNVLERFVKTIEKYNLKQIVRATGDNPLVSYELANMLIEYHNKNNNDYSGYLNSPVGSGVEVVESKVLIQALKETNDDYDKEHVTPYIYKNKKIFSVFQGDAPVKYHLKNTYVTIDTKEDYNRIVKLFHELYHDEIISLESVIEWLKKEQ